MTGFAERISSTEPNEAVRQLLAVAALSVTLVIAPWVGLYPPFIMKALCYALLACAFNLLIGYAGLLSFGHAMFLGSAGYFTAHALKAWDVPPELAILIGVAGAFALSVGAGMIAIRRDGIYFAMITLAVSQMVYFFFLQAQFTNGEDGIHGVKSKPLFGIVDLNHGLSLYFVIVVSFLAGLIAIIRIINSPFGEVLKAIRDNEPRAISLGYKVDRYKLAAFVLSGTFAGFAGALKVLVMQSATLTDVHWSMSGEIVLMTLIGGLCTLYGPIVGAFAIVAIEQYLAGYGPWVTIIQGGIFVCCVLVFRKGIVGEVIARVDRQS